MKLKNVLNTISGGTKIEIFANCKTIFCGCMCAISKEDFMKNVGPYLEEDVYRINYNKNKKAITIAV